MNKPAPKPFLEEPYLLFAVFVGVGVGTVLLQQPPRLALLWTTLVVLSLLYRSRQAVDWGFSLGNVGRGALLGLVISLPLLAFLPETLRLFSERLYGTSDVVLLFYQACFIAAPVEEYFFRGIVQGGRGPSASIGLYAATALLYFLPRAPLLSVFLMFMAMGLLGIVYGYVREHYGLVAAVASHAVVSLVLQVLPSLIALLRATL